MAVKQIIIQLGCPDVVCVQMFVCIKVHMAFWIHFFYRKHISQLLLLFHVAIVMAITIVVCELLCIHNTCVYVRVFKCIWMSANEVLLKLWQICYMCFKKIPKCCFAVAEFSHFSAYISLVRCVLFLFIYSRCCCSVCVAASIACFHQVFPLALHQT